MIFFKFQDIDREQTRLSQTKDLNSSKSPPRGAKIEHSIIMQLAAIF